MSLPDIYLASASPRRRELLDQLGVHFAQLEQDVPELRLPDEAPRAFVERLALAKARAGWQRLAPGLRRPVLGADTIVVVDEHILGKPLERNDGLAMLAKLSGRSHQVLTAVALVSNEGEALRLSDSRVTFRAIGAPEREAYWASGEPTDKAGGYAIQGLGAIFVARLEGSYSGVMGLPLFETAELLSASGVQLFGMPE